MANQDFVTEAYISNMFEVASVKLAINKSTNSNVKASNDQKRSDHVCVLKWKKLYSSDLLEFWRHCE